MATVAEKQIPQDVLAALSTAQVDGNVVKLTCGQLDRKVYVALNKVLENLGGKWNRKAQGHVFDGDPTDKLDGVILTGTYEPLDRMGYFPTPELLADMTVELADINADTTILEPSAGDGALVRACLRAGATKANITAVELQPSLVSRLEMLDIQSLAGDFLKSKPDDLGMFDCVVMNPPFERQQDIDHVTHAWQFVKPNGRLVAIMASGVTFRENRKTVEFREQILEPHGYVEPNPEGSFNSSGTGVNTVTVVLRKSL